MALILTGDYFYQTNIARVVFVMNIMRA